RPPGNGAARGRGGDRVPGRSPSGGAEAARRGRPPDSQPGHGAGAPPPRRSLPRGDRSARGAAEDLEESSAVRWFDLDEAIHRAGTPEMKRLLTKARAVLVG